MSIRISFGLRPKNRLTSLRSWTPIAAEAMVKELAGEFGCTWEPFYGHLILRFCPEGNIWFRWHKRMLWGESQTNIAGPGFHAAVIEFLERLADGGSLKLKVSDMTGYFRERNFFEMRRKYFYEWFTDLLKMVSGWENGKEHVFCWPSNEYIPEKQEGKLITHIRPFSFGEIKGMVNSGLAMAFARDFFIWNETYKDALYYRNCALALLNQSCFFMPSKRSEKDRQVNDSIIQSLETAYGMDPLLPFPRSEYLEICSLAGHEPMDISHTEPFPEGTGMGCRRNGIYQKLGNMQFYLPGYFLLEEKSTDNMDHYYDGLEYGGHDFYIYAVILGRRGIAKFKEAWFRQGRVEAAYRFETEAGQVKAIIYHPKEMDGALLYNLSAQVLFEGQRTNINITCRKPGETEWALDLIKKIKRDENQER